MDTTSQTTLSIFGQKESRLIQCTSKFVKFSFKLGKGGERSSDSVRKVKNQRVKGQMLGNRIILDQPHSEKETENIKKSKTKIKNYQKSQKSHRKDQIGEIWQKEGEFQHLKKAQVLAKQTASFYKMSFNTNMNNGTSVEDIERVGKLEGKTSSRKFGNFRNEKFVENSRISWNSCFFMNHEKMIFERFLIE